MNYEVLAKVCHQVQNVCCYFFL